MLQPFVEVAHVSALGCGEDGLPLKGVILECAFIDIGLVFEEPVLLGAILEESFEVVVVALFLALSVQSIVFEVALEEDGVGQVEPFAVASAVLDLSLVVVPIGVDEPAVPVRDA